ncbi:MAG: hypothetical protein GXO35_03930, partial [Gammaproteobacteria bacterium]|nr:hypothetical protein [Gammaproteobacteria bacterium]
LISPDYSPEHFTQSMHQLKTLINTHDITHIIGTSLGGYYALLLSQCFDIPTLAINPCFEPVSVLHKYIQQPAINYRDNTEIEFTDSMLAQFIALDKAQRADILIGLNDDVIPSEYQQAYCQNRDWQYRTNQWAHRVESVEALKAWTLAPWALA